ncbi:MAG: bifunctional 5,10-methylenetetrahydrofolate dehydrogenase/5,10-methenyltetrahydrofolate cyclohydrolase [Legionellales bacterium]|nr:bifunctional 5,10-methylenetetrahydrofolate dehydrogenase/5,10-methenyltetrahydrofolate cyclohydrolase [Legionellales bacterium]
MRLLDGNKVSNKLLDNVKTSLIEFKDKFNLFPKLATILVGNDPASEIYIKNKIEACKKIGILSKDIRLPNNIEQQELEEVIINLNQDPTITGILIQLPLPNHIVSYKILQKISPIKDVDGLSFMSMGGLCYDQSPLKVCTPLGILTLLNYYNLDNLQGKNVTIVGASIIVGKPLAIMCINLQATVTICNIFTKDLQNKINNADILVSAIGKRNIINSSWLKPNVIAIDVGINRDEHGNIYGDLDFETAKEVASFITPVPGGVGPMTIATLMENTLTAAKLQLDT